MYGVPNASIVMAAFLHVAPGGMRSNGPELGAWYAADDIRTAAAEVGHHLRRETVARGVATMSRTYRAYAATLLGDYLDIRGQQMTRSDVYASERYDASQKLGEEVRSSGGAGLIYDSLRRQTGVNVVAHRPRNITDIVQTDHLKLQSWQRRAPSTSANCRNKTRLPHLAQTYAANTSTEPFLICGGLPFRIRGRIERK